MGFFRSTLFAVFLGAISLGAQTLQDLPYDLLIINGRVMDGSGNPWVRVDIGVRAGQIVAIERRLEGPSANEIDAEGRLVTPGFIDVHSHAGVGLARPGLGQGRPLLAQGVTTIVANPDGGGPVDLAAQRAELEVNQLGLNVALLIGHGSIRRAVLGMDDRIPDEDEMEEMVNLVRRGMKNGAYGLSSGLFYAPGNFATTDELIALASVASEFGGLYTSHIRDEGNYSVGLIAAVNEVIRIAEEAKLPGIVSHMKVLGPDSWGLSVAATTRLNMARRRGVEVFADQYPYTASSTSLTGAFIPRWAQVGGEAELQRRMGAPETRRRLIEEVRTNLRRRGGAASQVIAFSRHDRSLEGRSLADIAEMRRQAPEETTLDLVAEGGASIVSFNMSEDDLEHIMRQSYTMTSSDGGLVPMGDGKPHPRFYGAHARKLERYVRNRKVVSLESAVRSMTSLPATVFGLTNRGVIQTGAWADLAIFEPGDIHETATYTDPHQVAQGMYAVVVNGSVVIENGKFTAATPGRVLSKN